MTEAFIPARYRTGGLADAPLEVSLPDTDASINPLAQNINADNASYQSKYAILKYWKNVLTSRNNTTPVAARPVGSKTAQAVPLWINGIGADALDAVATVLDQLAAMKGYVAGGDTPTSQMMGDLSDAEGYVVDKYPQAVAQAQQINALFDADADLIASGITPADLAPAQIVAPAVETYTPVIKAVTSAPGKAIAAVEGKVQGAADAVAKLTASAVGTTTTWLEYGAVGLVALAVLYVAMTVKGVLPNPPRRRRRA